MTKTIQRNKLLTVLTYITSAVSSLAATGTLMQTFLATLGLDPKLIYIHATLSNAVNILTLMLASSWVNTDNVLRRNAVITIPYAVLFLGYLPLCIEKSASAASFILLLLISLLQAVSIALRTVCTYTVPYILYPAEDFGPFSAFCGVLSSVFSLLLGALISLLTSIMDFTVLMIGAFTFSALLTAIEAILLFCMRSILPAKEQNERKKEEKTDKLPLITLFRTPVFCTLAIPAFFRGFASGTVGILAALAFDLGFDETVTTQMLYLQSAAGLLACVLIGFLSTRISVRHPVFWGSLSFLLLPCIFSGNPLLFLLSYTLVIFGRNLVDYGMPILMRLAVPMKIAGPYNAWRMMLHFGGTLLATTVAAIIPPVPLIILSVGTSLISGAGFFFAKVLRKI